MTDGAAGNDGGAGLTDWGAGMVGWRYGVWLHSWFGIPAFAGVTSGSGNDERGWE